MSNLKTLKPFTKEDPRIRPKPKGARSFKTIFVEAAREVSEALKLGKKPDAVQIELVKRGIREGLGGNFPFYKDLLDRLYGKEEGEENKVIKVQIDIENTLRKLAEK